MNPTKKQAVDEQPYDPIESAIESTRKDMRLLIDFYSGARTLNNPNPTLPRTDADDQRLLWTLKQLRERIETLQKKRDRIGFIIWKKAH